MSGGCKVYKELNSAARSVNQGPFPHNSGYKCDNDLTPGWYRFTGAAGTQMATSCVPEQHCGTGGPGWMTGELPKVAEGSVNRVVCYHLFGNCCKKKKKIMVRNCGGYFVYKLQKPPLCKLGYCGSGPGKKKFI